MPFQLQPYFLRALFLCQRIGHAGDFNGAKPVHDVADLCFADTVFAQSAFEYALAGKEMVGVFLLMTSPSL